jgi:hypothetical protein
VFEEILKGEERRTDISLRPVEENATATTLQHITWVGI